jgi:AhpD family alkylhydroperoxidase
MGHYAKRFYSPAGLLRDLAHLPATIAGLRHRTISREFAEKVMLVVTEVNGCRYCSFVHAGMALRSGMDAEEVAALLALQTERFPAEEAVALAYAQHYAETGGHPDPEAENRLRACYGPKARRDIVNAIRLITFGNLAGNTVDAFLSRLCGEPARGSNPLGELLLFLFLAPFTLPLLWPMRQAARHSSRAAPRGR